jgi:hypothetical protein
VRLLAALLLLTKRHATVNDKVTLAGAIAARALKSRHQV